MDLLTSLIIVSEKAANVARKCRQDEHLFNLLVQKKQTDEANPRFVDDFKTLADVLIQQMVIHDLGHKFPAVRQHIRGEENNMFCNKLGDSIRVEVKSTEEETSELLVKVLNGDKRAADLLANEVHRQISIDSVNVKKPDKDFRIDIDDLGIWIDPIDCTAEYVSGGESVIQDDICLSGLQCVTVLIGVYSRKLQKPLIGVVNQPFVNQSSNSWHGRCYWGVCLDNETVQCSLDNSERSQSRRNIVSVSSSELETVKMQLNENGWKLLEAAGAGYKIVTVIQGLADAYVLSKPSTFKWDTCAPHAILRSLGGDIVNYRDIVESGSKNSLLYPAADEHEANSGGSGGGGKCNLGGFIAFRDANVLHDIVEILQKIY